MGNSGCFPRGKPAATESHYPTYSACWVFQCFRNPPNSDMDYWIFNVSTDVNACVCKRGCKDTVRESALKVDSGRKIPCRTRESNLRLRRDGPMLYQLSYITYSAMEMLHLPKELVIWTEMWCLSFTVQKTWIFQQRFSCF